MHLDSIGFGVRSWPTVRYLLRCVSSTANLPNRDTEGDTVTIPALIGKDLYTKYDWNFTTASQPSLDNGKRAFNSGRAVGGSSILNGLVWTRGAACDYDAWAALGNPGWGWKDLLPYFKKVSCVKPPTVPRLHANRCPRAKPLPVILILITARPTRRAVFQSAQRTVPRDLFRWHTRTTSTSSQVRMSISSISEEPNKK